MEKLNEIKAWIMSNKVIAGVVGFVLLLILYKKFVKKTYRRRRRLTPVRTITRRRSYKKGGATKKAWQIKGSLAAKRRMALLRRKRNRVL